MYIQVAQMSNLSLSRVNMFCCLTVTACPRTRSCARWPAIWTNQISCTNSWTWPTTTPCGTHARCHAQSHPRAVVLFSDDLLPPDPHLNLPFSQGAAFGFHTIAAKAGEQLAPFLPQIVPRLYRYQFDPNLSVRQAMTSIWDALVTDKTLVGSFPWTETVHPDRQMLRTVVIYQFACFCLSRWINTWRRSCKTSFPT